MRGREQGWCEDKGVVSRIGVFLDIYFPPSTDSWGQGGTIGETKFILSTWKTCSREDTSLTSGSIWFHPQVTMADR